MKILDIKLYAQAENVVLRMRGTLTTSHSSRYASAKTFAIKICLIDENLRVFFG